MTEEIKDNPSVWMENTKDGHDKFYYITRTGCIIHMQWGPNSGGAFPPIQEQIKEFETEEEADKFMEQKVKQKLLNRGYEVIKASNFAKPVVIANVVL